jgi:hypothetical protein
MGFGAATGLRRSTGVSLLLGESDNPLNQYRDRRIVRLRLTPTSILGATGKISQLKTHVKGGLLNGLTEAEIRESMMHVIGYCGFPTGLDA